MSEDTRLREDAERTLTPTLRTELEAQIDKMHWTPEEKHRWKITLRGEGTIEHRITDVVVDALRKKKFELQDLRDTLQKDSRVYKEVAERIREFEGRIQQEESEHWWFFVKVAVIVCILAVPAIIVMIRSASQPTAKRLHERFIVFLPYQVSFLLYKTASAIKKMWKGVPKPEEPYILPTCLTCCCSTKAKQVGKVWQFDVVSRFVKILLDVKTLYRLWHRDELYIKIIWTWTTSAATIIVFTYLFSRRCCQRTKFIGYRRMKLYLFTCVELAQVFSGVYILITWEFYSSLLFSFLFSLLTVLETLAGMEYGAGFDALGSAEAQGQRLCELGKRGDVDGLQRLVESKADISTGDHNDATGLHVAAGEGKLLACKFFLEGKVDPNIQDHWNRSPLDYALDFMNGPMMSGKASDDPVRNRYDSVVKLLKDWRGQKGAGTPFRDTPDKARSEVSDLELPEDVIFNDYYSAKICSYAQQNDIDGLRQLEPQLAAQKINMSVGDYDRRTGIHLAASEGHGEMCRFFLEAKVNPNLRDRWNNTPLDDAVRGCFKEVQQILRDHGGVAGTKITEKMICDPAANGQLERLRDLAEKGMDMSQGNENGRTGLHFAAASGYGEVCRFFLEKKVNVNVKDRWYNTPFDDAVRHNHDDVKQILRTAGGDTGTKLTQKMACEICELAFQGDCDGLRDLSKKGIDMSQGDYDERTGIHLAASSGRLEVCKLILEELGVKPNPADRWSHTPLDDAVREKYPEVAQYLRSKGGFRGSCCMRVIEYWCCCFYLPIKHWCSCVCCGCFYPARGSCCMRLIEDWCCCFYPGRSEGRSKSSASIAQGSYPNSSGIPLMDNPSRSEGNSKSSPKNSSETPPRLCKQESPPQP